MTLDDVEQRLAAIEASNKALAASMHASASMQRLALGLTVGFIAWTIYQQLSPQRFTVRVLDAPPAPC